MRRDRGHDTIGRGPRREPEASSGAQVALPALRLSWAAVRLA